MLAIDPVGDAPASSRPLTSCSLERLASPARFVQRVGRRLAEHDRARRPREVLQALREVHGVADERVLEPLLRPEQRGRDLAGRQADAEPERRQAVGPPRARSPRPGARASRTPPRNASSAWSSCGNGAPNTAITASPTNCITVPPSSRIAWFISARCSLSCAGERGRVGALGDARVAADVGHEHGDHRAPRSRRSRRPSSRSFSARPPGSSRLSVSPCSSRSTIAWCSSRSRRSAPSVPGARVLRRASRNSSLDRVGDRLGRGRAARAAIALIGRPSATSLQELLLVASSSSPSSATGRTSASTIFGSSSEPPVATSRTARDELVALGDAVLQQVGVAGRAVGEQRDRVLGVVVLREDDDAGAGVALAQLLGRVDALVLEARRHADVGDEHLGRGGFGAGDELVVVAGDADDLEVRLEASSARTPSRTMSVSSARKTRDPRDPRRCPPGSSPVPASVTARLEPGQVPDHKGGLHRPTGGAGTPALRRAHPLAIRASRSVGSHTSTRTYGRARHHADRSHRSRRVSWIPSEAVTGDEQGHVRAGIAHYDDPPPDVHRRPGRRCATPTGSASPTASRRGSRSRTAGSSPRATPAAALMGATTVRLGERRRRSRPCRARAAARARDRRSAVGALRADRRRAHRRCPAPRRVNHPPFVQFEGADGVDDARAHAPRRRHARRSSSSARARSRATGSTTTTASSRRRPGSPTSRSGTAHAFGKHTPWGDEDSAGARHRGRDRARARAVERRSCAAAAKPEIRKVKEGQRSSSRASRATSCSSCSTACCRSRSTASRSPSSARRRSSASGRCSRAVGARRRCAPYTKAASPSPRRPDRPRRAPRAERGPPPRGQRSIREDHDAAGARGPGASA